MSSSFFIISVLILLSCFRCCCIPKMSCCLSRRRRISYNVCNEQRIFFIESDYLFFVFSLFIYLVYEIKESGDLVEERKQKSRMKNVPQQPTVSCCFILYTPPSQPTIHFSFLQLSVSSSKHTLVHTYVRSQVCTTKVEQCCSCCHTNARLLETQR